jgi:hypothetical protein
MARVTALAFKFEQQMAKHPDWREVMDAIDLARTSYRAAIFRPAAESPVAR